VSGIFSTVTGTLQGVLSIDLKLLT
jgi:hypothetical protein